MEASVATLIGVAVCRPHVRQLTENCTLFERPREEYRERETENHEKRCGV